MKFLHKKFHNLKGGSESSHGACIISGNFQQFGLFLSMVLANAIIAMLLKAEMVQNTTSATLYSLLKLTKLYTS